jgi:hypothetical protein
VKNYLWQLLVLLICLPVAVLATGIPIPFLDRPFVTARPQQVPSGDQEMAWMHTTTNLTTWERFVSGCKRVEMAIPELMVDDSRAFVEDTTSVPEVVISHQAYEGKLRIRWYKLSGEATAENWMKALAERSTPPLAVIGGGSSDRAADLARAMQNQVEWKGQKPILLITTATAEEISSEDQLIDIYKERSFRFCFTNRQMAQAVLDFVWSRPELRPESFVRLAHQAVCSSLFPVVGVQDSPTIFGVSWQDDPYSIDLAWQFKTALRRTPLATIPEPQILSWTLPYSVGGFSKPNLYEAKNASSILEELSRLPPQRSLLILPTITQPARRLLRTLAESSPQLGRRLVAVSGDGIPVNALYRDGDFAWPVHSIPVPLVLFLHHNPLGWDVRDQPVPPPSGYELIPPNSTEDVLHFAEMCKVVIEAVFRTASPLNTAELPNATELRQRLFDHSPAFFDPQGNRLDNTGEYVALFTPKLQEGNAGLRTLPVAKLEVWQRKSNKSWSLVRAIDVQTNRSKTELQPKERP